MNTFAIIKSHIIEKSIRLFKVFQYGAKTAIEIAPFGDDGNPLKDMVAVFSNTSDKSKDIIIGYINKNQLSLPGEKRIFSLKSDGSLSFAIWLKNDGTAELGGNSDNLVRYTPLASGISNSDVAINAELVKISTAISSLGGTYVPTPIQTNIDSSKINEIKTL